MLQIKATYFYLVPKTSLSKELVVDLVRDLFTIFRPRFEPDSNILVRKTNLKVKLFTAAIFIETWVEACMVEVSVLWVTE